MAAKTARKAPASGTLLDPTGLGKVLDRAFEKEPAGSVMFVDLDGLFGLNEVAGREVGDRVIETAMRTIRRWGEADGWTVARIGGDEFALYSADAQLETAFLKADRLRQELDAAMAKELPKGHKCTASVGVAAAPRDARSPGELMKKGSEALWAAKDQGGDTVALAPGADMVLKSSYYTAAQLGRLRSLAERMKKKESVLLREALDELIRKYDRA